MKPTLGDRLVELIKQEVDARETGRKLELDPSLSEEARAMFARASLLRRRRLALLRSCGVL